MIDSMSPTSKKISDLPEVSVREVIHRMRFWAAVKAIPGAEKMEVAVTLPNRSAQCRFYSALIQELGAVAAEAARPMQTPWGDFVLTLEDTRLRITSARVPL